MKRSSGFTLLEVMIAVAILAVSLLAIFNLQSTSLLGSARAQKIEVATHLARSKMAELLLDLEKGITKGEFPDEKEESGTFEEERYAEYRWKMTVKKVDIPVPPLPEGMETDIMTRVLKTVSEQISESSREVKLSIASQELEDEEEEMLITLTTHIVKM